LNIIHDTERLPLSDVLNVHALVLSHHTCNTSPPEDIIIHRRPSRCTHCCCAPPTQHRRRVLLADISDDGPPMQVLHGTLRFAEEPQNTVITRVSSHSCCGHGSQCAGSGTASTPSTTRRPEGGEIVGEVSESEESEHTDGSGSGGRPHLRGGGALSSPIVKVRQGPRRGVCWWKVCLRRLA